MVKNLPASSGDTGLIPGLGRSPGEGNGNPLQYSCLGNPMDRGAWWAIVYRVAKSWRWLSHWTTTTKKTEKGKVFYKYETLILLCNYNTFLSVFSQFPNMVNFCIWSRVVLFFSGIPVALFFLVPDKDPHALGWHKRGNPMRVAPWVDVSVLLSRSVLSLKSQIMLFCVIYWSRLIVDFLPSINMGISDFFALTQCLQWVQSRYRKPSSWAIV